MNHVVFLSSKCGVSRRGLSTSESQGQTKAADHGGLGLFLLAAQNLKNGIFAPESS